MCGIAGILQKHGLPPGPRIDSAIGQISHRGPDRTASIAGDGWQLAASRLSIRDIEHGHQPIRESGVALAFNGEIYNDASLSMCLPDEYLPLTTKCDTELVIKAYRSWGAGCFRRFNGMFATAIVDEDRRRLILARDRFGQKPLFFYQNEDFFMFASEIKAILSIFGEKIRIDREALTYSLLFERIYDPDTPFTDIKSIPPGHYLEVPLGSGIPGTPVRYWNLPDSGDTEHPDYEEFHSLLKDSVRICLRSDTPPATVVSGGLDSSVIAAIAAGLTSQQLNCFSMQFPEDDLDESRFQSIVAQHLQAVRHPFDAGISGPTECDAKETLWHSEYPDLSVLQDSIWGRFFRFIRDRGFKVVLGGEGADELLRGYSYYEYFPHLFNFLSGGHSDGASRLSMSASDYGEYARHEAVFLEQFRHPSCLISLGWPVKLFTHPPTHRQYLSELLADPHNYRGPRYQSKSELGTFPNDYLQRTDIETRLPGYILRIIDRQSMRHGVEVRSPFLDHRLFEWVWRLSPRARSALGTDKSILRSMPTPSLPESVRCRRKQGFTTPDRMDRDFETCSWSARYLSPEMAEKWNMINPDFLRHSGSQTDGKVIQGALHRELRYRIFVLHMFCETMEERCRNIPPPDLEACLTEILATQTKKTQERSLGNLVVFDQLVDAATFKASKERLTGLRERNRFVHDDLFPGRHFVHNDSFFRIMHRGLTPLVIRATGKRVKPSYCFLADAGAGCVVYPHKDRPQCEYNLTYVIEQTGPETDLPFYLRMRTGVQKVVLQEGGGVLYQGHKVTHWRDPIPTGVNLTVCIFHFVLADFNGCLD